MKRLYLISVLFMTGLYLRAQNPCINDSLLFYTAASNWTIIHNSFGAPNSIPPFEVVPQLNTINGIPQAQWVSYQTPWIMYGVLNDPTDSMTIRYTFELCQTDSVTFSFLFRRDNYCKLKLDGNLLFSEAPTFASDNYYIGDSINQTFFLTKGIHQFDFVIYNVYPYTGNNGFGGIIGGYIISDKESLLMKLPACSSCCNLAPPTISGNTILCEGDTTSLTAVGSLIYTWTGGISNGVSFMPSSTQTYTVTASDPFGCTATNSVTVFVTPAFDVQVSKNHDIICNKTSSVLTATGAQTYTWSPAGLLSTSTGPQTITQINETTTFYVTGTTGPCTDQDSITVWVTKGNLPLIIPNAFSPNQDGNNDCLRVITKRQFSRFHFAIYNRWGQLVYESVRSDDCWNGFFNGKPAASDTYYYYLKAVDACGDSFLKGDIQLIR